MRPAEALEGEPHRLLRPGLADRAGDRDDLRGRAPAGRGAEAAHGIEHVRHDEERAGPAELGGALFRDHRRRRALGQRAAHEAVAVMNVALDGEEELARLKRARIDRDAGDGRHCAEGAGFGRRQQFVRRP